MRQARIQLTDRPPVDFAVANEPADTFYFTLGIRKCGSSLMNKVVRSLASSNGRNFVDVAGSFFEAGIPETEWRNDGRIHGLLSPGNVYGGFRAMPSALKNTTEYKAGRKVLLVRDPRDALVSEYFSVAFSHSLPQQAGARSGAREQLLAAREQARASSIDDFVLTRAASMNKTFMEYADFGQELHARIFLYEDAIMNKRPWISAMTSHFGWRPDDGPGTEKILAWADTIPTSENQQDFIRKVVPGDHKDKLTANVISELNGILRPSLEAFGYN